MVTGTPTEARAGVGPLLRDWRRRRHVSQLELALDAGISTRHLSFVETGRSRPSAEMVLRLAERLEVPLRERNGLLLAAGHAPHYGTHDLDDAELGAVRDAVGHVLAGHEPYPAIAVDRHWTLISSNAALDPLLCGVAPQLLVPPVNTIRLALHPDGMAGRIVNLAECREDLIGRLARGARLSGDARLAELRDEMLGYPGPPEPEPGTRPGPWGGAADPAGAAVMVPMVLDPPAGADGWPRLSFFSTISTFGTAADVTVSELAIEAFFPADETTAAFLRR